MRGRSYSPSPPPRGSYGRRGRSPSPRGRYRGRSRDLPTSLLVRNLRHGCRPEDLRRPFGHFGPLKDIYLPRDYYTGHQSSNKSSLEDDVNGSEDGKEVGYEYILKTSSLEEFQAILKLTLASQPRGFGFVQYIDPADAAEAKYQMDGQILLGRELTVVFAEENRKKPTDMRARERGSGGGRYDRRRSPRYSRSRSHSPQYSRSPPPRRGRSRSRSQGYDSPPPKRKHYSRSVSPQERRHSEERRRGQLQCSRSPSPNGSRSPSRSRSRSPARGQRGQSRSVTPNSDRSPRQ